MSDRRIDSQEELEAEKSSGHRPEDDTRDEQEQIDETGRKLAPEGEDVPE